MIKSNPHKAPCCSWYCCCYYRYNYCTSPIIVRQKHSSDFIVRLTRNLVCKSRIMLKYSTHNQISKVWKIQDGGRPPFWKWFYHSISAVHHPISMQFRTQIQIFVPQCAVVISLQDALYNKKFSWCWHTRSTARSVCVPSKIIKFKKNKKCNRRDSNPRPLTCYLCVEVYVFCHTTWWFISRFYSVFLFELYPKCAATVPQNARCLDRNYIDTYYCNYGTSTGCSMVLYADWI